MIKKDEILKMLMAGELNQEEALQLLDQCEEKNRSDLYCKVSQKGAVSVYGLQRMPVTLYAQQWERLLQYGDHIHDFIQQHASELIRK